jgi:hypothetical protein
MAAPLSDCIIEERVVVHFLLAEEVKSAEIHRQMLAQCRTLHHASVKDLRVDRTL